MSIVKTKMSYGWDYFCQISDHQCRWESYSEDGVLLRTETQSDRLTKTIYSNGRTTIYSGRTKVREYHGEKPIDILRTKHETGEIIFDPKQHFQESVLGQLVLIAKNQRNN